MAVKKAKRPVRPKRRRAKQQMIPGTEGPRIPTIDKAAEEYVDIRDERMGLQKSETSRHDHLLGLMREAGLNEYEFDGSIVRLTSTSKVKVKRKKEAEAETAE